MIHLCKRIISMTLSKAQHKTLRGMCHHINPVVMIGQNGLTENVMNEIELALTHHELIKIRLRASPAARKLFIDRIGKVSGAELILKTGQVACFYRINPAGSQLESEN